MAFDFHTYSLYSCKGFSEASNWVASGTCLKARFGLIILFFLIAILRKWGAEEIGMPFSFIFSLIGGLGSYILVATFTGSFKFALVIGIVVALVAGYGVGQFFDDTSDGGGF